MSGMEGNPHVTENLIRFADGNSTPEQGLAQAALAIAYEQRTANLIAVFNASVEPDDTETFIGERLDPYTLAQDIVARLAVGERS